MIKTFNKLIPTPIKKRILKTYRDYERENRRATISQLPRAFLEEKHMQNCKLVLNRYAMLQNIGQQGVIAELGVNRGEFSQQLLEISKPTVLHLVDVWDTDRYNDGLFKEINSKFKENIDNGSVKIHRKLSIEVANEFPDEYFDMIYIDTDHSYGTTRKELLAFHPKMKRNGIIAGHDYSMGNWVKTYRYGVIEAVHEFCVEFDWELCWLTAEPLEKQSFAIRKIQ